MPPAMLTISAADLLLIREERNRLLGRRLFLPSAWDILLYLQSIGEPRSIDQICRKLAMRAPNARRWLAVLCEEGLVETSADAAGNTLFGLTESASGNLVASLSAGQH